jgi:hypothetical protein
MAGQDIEALVREFAAKLEGAIRAQVVQEIDAAVQAALGAGFAGIGSSSRLRTASLLESAGGKRSPAELARTADRLLRFIKSNPDQRAEQIAEGVGMSTKTLALPLRKLVAEKRLKTKGVARGTTYTVVG